MVNFNPFTPLLRSHSNQSIDLLCHQVIGVHMMGEVTLNVSSQCYAHIETSRLICTVNQLTVFFMEITLN